MVKLNGTTITLTRGDTLRLHLTLNNADGTTYSPSEGDTIRFAAKTRYSDKDAVLYKEIPTDTLILTLDPSDTKNLGFRDYVYDIQITYANGDVDTFIAEATLKIAAEVE